MEFDLSEELINEIIFAMENQTSAHVFDSSEARIIEKKAGMDAGRYYDLPPWDSSSGFKIRERFVLLLRNPPLQAKLREALFSGKSVFRQFKSVLKESSEAEKLWNTFRNRELGSLVLSWYNTLREMWGLEKLGEEPEDHEELVNEDFAFHPYEAAKDEMPLMMAVNEALHEFEEYFEGEAGTALAALWQSQRQLSRPEKELTLVCETVYGEFAGCISACSFPEHAEQTVLLTTWLIRAQFRGFGLGKELLDLCLAELESRGIRWVILANLAVPHYISSVLSRCGFNRIGSGFIADLKNINNKKEGK